MKAGLHPELKQTKVHCNGCSADFVTSATVDAITVDICSNCHPFYTGKQKLVDTAGRVEKFKQRTAAAKTKQAAEAKRAADKIQNQDPEMHEIADELKEKTVDQAAEAKKTEA